MNMPSSNWATAPLNMEGAATALGVSLRTMFDVVKAHPHYERRGRKKVFYPEHIEMLRKGLNECASQSNGTMDGPMPTAPALMGSESENLSKLVTLAERRKRQSR
ncbi:MAG: hypothetical protein ABJE77_19465 [Tateyamaria sp.]